MKEKVYFTFLKMAAFLNLLILFSILFYILEKGINFISFNFLTDFWAHREITEGGIFQAIVGTFYLGVLVILFAVPVGIFTAIYLNEYAGKNKIAGPIRAAIRNLAGVPSIVYGLFGLAVFVHFLGFGFSLLAAVLTLACLTLPWIITASEEALRNIPVSFREASFSLGATQWQTLRKVTLPTALPGMITGSIIGLARAVGETAPIILVGAVFFLPYLSLSPLDSFMALPYHIFILATHHTHPAASGYAAATAVVLIVLVGFMVSGAMIWRYKIRQRQKW